MGYPVNKITKEEFLQRSKDAHGDFYDYSKVVYENTKTKVKIVCPIHGVFETVPETHMKGHNCRSCAMGRNGESQRKNLDWFLDRSLKVHGNRYDYTRSVYVTSKTKLEIICKEHGSFWCTPYNHYKGKGCSKCFSVGGDKEYCEMHPETNLYLMRISNKGEEYLKVGISVNPQRRCVEIKSALGGDSKVRLVTYSTIPSEFALRMESAIHNSKILPKYTPDNWFLGGTECYSLDAFEFFDKGFRKLYNKYGGFNAETEIENTTTS